MPEMQIELPDGCDAVQFANDQPYPRLVVFDTLTNAPHPEWFEDAVDGGLVKSYFESGRWTVDVKTPVGLYIIHAGDWIIRDRNGGLFVNYSGKSDIVPQTKIFNEEK